MSRIGRMPIKVPAGIQVSREDNLIVVKKGNEMLSTAVSPEFKVNITDTEITVERPSDDRTHRSMHGLYRSLINNMVVGLSEGFTKKLEIVGIGFRASKQGNKLVMNLGYSHPIELEEPEGITIEVPAQNRITVKGADKQLVGETAAKIRGFRVPDAYHGKGVRYEGEYVRIKEGKSGAKAK